MSEWPMVKLGELLKPSPKKTAGELDAPILSITMHEGLVEQDNRFKKRIASLDTSIYRVVFKGQLVVGFPIDEGVLDFQDKYSQALVSPAYGVWDLVSDEVTPEFLGLFLKSPRAISIYKSRLRGTTARRRSLPTKVFQEIEFLLPPLGEQKRIAEILGEASKTIKDTEKIIHNVQGLKRSALRGILDNKSGEYVQLSQISSVQSGITKGRKVQNGITLMPTPYMAVSNVKAGYLDLSEVKQIDASEAEVNRYQLQAGDILLTEGGDPDKLGRGTIWRNEIPGAIHQNHIFRVRINPDSGFTSEALMAILESTESKGYFLRSAKQTTGISSINKRQLSATPIPVLDKVQIEELTNMWHKIDEVIELYHRKLSLLQELQKSLATRAFAGLL